MSETPTKKPRSRRASSTGVKMQDVARLAGTSRPFATQSRQERSRVYG
jgi:hypothetical protein